MEPFDILDIMESIGSYIALFIGFYIASGSTWVETPDGSSWKNAFPITVFG